MIIAIAVTNGLKFALCLVSAAFILCTLIIPEVVQEYDKYRDDKRSVRDKEK